MHNMSCNADDKSMIYVLSLNYVGKVPKQYPFREPLEASGDSW